MSRKISVTLLLCFAALLGGCSKKQTAEQEEYHEPEKIVLEFYTWKDEESYMAEMVENYMKEKPDIVVRLHAIPTSEYRQGLEILFNGDRPVDIFASSKPSVSAVCQEKGYSLDLTPYAEKEDLSGYGLWFEDLKQENKIYMIPYRMSSWVVYYNKKIFDEFHIPYPQEGWTWEDYTEIARKISRTTEDGRRIYGSMSFDLTGSWWRTLARTTGKENPLDPEGFLELKRAAKWNYEMAYEYEAQQKYTEFTSVDSSDYNRIFLEGNTGMFFNGEWCLPILNSAIEKNQKDFAYDVAPMPHWEGEDSYFLATAAVMSVAAGSDHPKEAFDFIRFACGAKGAEILAQRSLLPAWNSSEIKEVFKESLLMPEHVEYFFNTGEVSQILPSKEYEEALEIVRKNVNQYLLQEITLEQAFSSSEEEFKEKGLWD